MPIRLPGNAREVVVFGSIAQSGSKLVAQSREEIQERVAKEQLERELIRKGVLWALQQNAFMTIGDLCAAINRELGFLINGIRLAEELAALEFHSHVRRRGSVFDALAMYSLSPPKQCEAEIIVGGKRHPVH